MQDGAYCVCSVRFQSMPVCCVFTVTICLAAWMLYLYSYLIYFDKAYPNPHCCSILQVVELFCGHTRVKLLFVGMYPFFFLIQHEIQYPMMAQFTLQFMEQSNFFLYLSCLRNTYKLAVRAYIKNCRAPPRFCISEPVLQVWTGKDASMAPLWSIQPARFEEFKARCLKPIIKFQVCGVFF